MTDGSTAELARDDRGRFCDPNGRNRPWHARLVRVPDHLRQASKPRLADELLRLREQRDLLAQTIGSDPLPSVNAGRVREMRKRQSEDLVRRTACLRELIMEAALRRQIITPDRYEALAAAMSERLGTTFHWSTLYRPPYSLILENPDYEDDESNQAKRALMREGRASLLKSIDVIMLEIDQLRGAIQQAVSAMPIKPDPIRSYLFPPYT